MLVLSIMLALVAGAGIGWFAHVTWGRLGTARRAVVLSHDEYLARRDRLDRAYTDSMKEYDRLVTWASGGALLASITFLEKIAPRPIQSTAWLLGTGWTLLVASFLMSLTSQYASSRVHSWRMSELDHLQLGNEDRAADWESIAARLNRGCAAWGRATKWLTFLSGVVLVAAAVFLSLFAYRNTTFF
jgi:hypothetical protein